MKGIVKLILLLVFLSNNIFAQDTIKELKKVRNNSFKVGEHLKFKVYYHSLLTGKVNAGEATLDVKTSSKTFHGRKALHIVGLGYTKGFFNMFFKVMDRYETYIDAESILPWLFVRRVNEGGYVLNQDIAFDRFKNTAQDLIKNKTYNVPEDIHDLVSAYYYARLTDCSKLKINDTVRINTLIDFEIYPLKLKYLGKAILRTSIGTINCVKFAPILQADKIFSDKDAMLIYFSDDNNHLPIMLEAKILVGSIRMELIKYSNIMEPLNIRK